MSQIKIKNISFSYGNHAVLKDIDLTIEEGELHSLLGLSGCGKTTLLRLIAGFLAPSAGKILLDDSDITNAPPEKRRMGVVFQNYALFLHMTVEQNVAYGLRVDRLPKNEIKEKVDEYLSLVNMTDFRDRNVSELSGGQQQRVALARALVRGVDVLLLDEPMSNLDVSLREKMRAELRSLQEKLGITTLLITHEQAEALSVSDRVSVMNAGNIEQTGIPSEIYENPETPFVRDFVGEMNVFDKGSIWEKFYHLESDEKIFIRPEHLWVERDESPSSVKGTISAVKYSGPTIQLALNCSQRSVKVLMLNTPTTCKFEIGECVYISQAK